VCCRPWLVASGGQGVGWDVTDREHLLPDIEPLAHRTLGIVMSPGRQGEGSRVGENQVINIGILYKRMAIVPITIKDKNDANGGREDKKHSN